MKHYFALRSASSTQYHVVCCDKAESEIISLLTKKGYERITRKQAEHIVSLERQSRNNKPSLSLFGNDEIEIASSWRGMLMFLDPKYHPYN